MPHWFSKRVNQMGSLIFLMVFATMLHGGTYDYGADRPQEPQPPYPYFVRDVRYTSDVDGSVMAGTITIPKDADGCTAVLLISGSGLQDRDETTYGHKPFKVLADFLARRGIIVLRVDDRGVNGSTGSPWNATTPEILAKDALAGVKYLQGLDEVDARRIGLIGHSEGALVASIAASESKDISYIVMMAGLGIPWPENALLAVKEGLTRLGKDEEIIKANQDLMGCIFHVVRRGHASDRTEDELRSAIADWRNSLEGKAKQEFDVYSREHPGHWDMLADQFAEPSYRYYMNADPGLFVEKVTCPVLAICGEHDVQVMADVNLTAIREALSVGGNTRSRIEMLPGLNHLFQHSSTGLTSEYRHIEETFAPEAMDLIASWIEEQQP